jgi:serine/threonine protein kinase/tetratricopeptide (TPR) repeat protein
MVRPTSPQSWLELEKYVEAYESARTKGRDVDLGEFLPGPGHPLYAEVLLELVRVDLEYHWAQGRPRRLEEYQRRFPQFLCQPWLLKEVAFEEYRLRHQAGEAPTPEDYQRRFGVDTTGWPNPWIEAREDPEVRPFPCDPELPSAAQAELLRDLQRSDPEAARRLEQALTSLPAEGSEFLGFDLLTELGRGAFGKVYLARQSDLANRPIVLKISGDLWGESQTLAQLQHTNIVPIYSVHRRGPLQAVCMPYFGSTTLADLIQVLRKRPSLPASGKGLVDTLEVCKSVTRENRPAPPSAIPAVLLTDEAAEESAPSPFDAKAPILLQKLGAYTYAEAVLWIGARLADGLGHAHERGILHLDLKPANILLTDDGQAMLLDFNLSADLKLYSSVSVAKTGGTLPYMAPEQLEALRGGDRTVDARSDVYSLGVCLYELLTGQHTFPIRRGPVQDIIGPMIADRLQPPPSIRNVSRAVPPAVEALLRRCLAPEPSQRYQTARELQEDLERQLEHRPLRHAPNPSLGERVGKWMRRHPRGLPTGFAVVAAVLLAALGIFFVLRGQRLARWQARETLSLFEDERAQAQSLILRTRGADAEQVQEGKRQGLQSLERYQVLNNPRWLESPPVSLLPAGDQERLRRDVGDLLLLLARAELLETSVPPTEALQAALRLNYLAERCYPAGPPPQALWKQRAALAQRLGQNDEAEQAQAKATETSPQSAADLCLLASEHTAQGRFLEALPLLHEATRQEPQNFWAWYSRGICYENVGEDAKAEACFDVCTALWPTFPWSYYHRGLTFLRRENYPLAAADFDQVLRLRPGLASAHVSRALARQGMKQYDLAIEDLTTALELGAPETRIYFTRATARARAGDQEGARRDREEGLRRVPTDAESWAARGVARLPRDVQGALADFEEALKRNPHSLAGLQNKAHVLAELQGRTEEGVRVLNEAVEAYPGYVPSRAARGVLLARLGKRQPALKDAEDCLARDSQPATLYQVAGIYALTSRECAEDRLEALRLLSAALRKGFGLDLLARDTDLDPIRKDPEFVRIVAAARAARSQDASAGGSKP